MRIEEYIDDDFSGVVSVNKNDKSIYRKAFGYANLPNRVLNEIDTKFATASAGKVFVAVATLQLIEQGRLSFESYIGDILEFDLIVCQPKCDTSSMKAS